MQLVLSTEYTPKSGEVNPESTQLLTLGAPCHVLAREEPLVLSLQLIAITSVLQLFKEIKGHK